MTASCRVEKGSKSKNAFLSKGSNNMSNIANITVFDGAATPVSHVLVPVSVTRKDNMITALWREQLTGVPLEGQVSFTTQLEQLKSGTWHYTATVQVPVMESVSGQNSAGYTASPKVAFIDTVKAEGFHSRRSTITGRRLARQILANLMGNISTSVAPVATGFTPELIDQLISAT
jgi:hypothetical protein